SMSKKQEYIAPIKYQNSLPVPQLPPKLLAYPEAPETNPDSSQLINSLYVKTNISNLIQQDEDLGMPVDLMKFPGLLNKLDSKLLYGFDNVKLDKDDRILLRDPRIDRLTKT
uniref:PAF1-like protein n=1 Tax=Saccharomyces eubayanus TaxID=1080349 RepID=UPI0024B877E8|nr:Chain P, PAF1-like protein [Saccharomyces eubayanus]